MPIFQADLPMFGFYVGGKIILSTKLDIWNLIMSSVEVTKKVPIFFLLGIFLH